MQMATHNTTIGYLLARRPDFAAGVAATLARPPGPPAAWDPPAASEPVSAAVAEALFGPGAGLFDPDSDPLV